MDLVIIRALAPGDIFLLTSNYLDMKGKLELRLPQLVLLISMN